MTDKYLQALRTLARLAPQLEDQLLPSGGNCQDSYTPPATPTSRPPCNLTWLDMLAHVKYLLTVACAQVRADTGNLHGKPVPTIAGRCGWLANQADHLDRCMWLDSETWWGMHDGEGTLAWATITAARQLEDALDPPIKHPPAGTATQMSIATGIPAETIRNRRRAGKLDATKINGTWVYKLTDIQQIGTRQ